MKRLFKQFSFPGGIPSHVAPETPGSIHEGGELGYSLSHAYRRRLRQSRSDRRLRRRRRRGRDRPARHRWHSNKFLDPVARRRRAADPAPQRLQDRQPHGPRPHPARGTRAALPRLRLQALLRRGRRPGEDAPAHGRHARQGRRSRSARASRQSARANGFEAARPRWPMIVLRTPQGLDRPQGGRRPADRGQLPLAPGAAWPTWHSQARARSASSKTG